MGECIILGNNLQNNNIADSVVMGHKIVSNMGLIKGNPFDIGRLLKEHIGGIVLRILVNHLPIPVGEFMLRELDLIVVMIFFLS
jgi:hypothetical protein